MKKIMMREVILLFITISVSTITGRLVVLRGKEEVYRYSYNRRRLVCVSEDDDGALIWNSNLYWQYDSYAFSDRDGNTDFSSLATYQRKELDCDLNSYEKCMSLWNTTDWSLTNSAAKPMGPVFDRRWEGFTEYNNFHSYNEYRLLERLNKSGALVFSIRGSNDAHILLCESENYESDFCYWIIIGGWKNTKSAIRKCAKGVPHPTMYPDSSTECAQIKAFYSHEPLSATEWRTFVLVMNESTRNISFYDTQKMLLTYVDSGNESKKSNERYYLFLRSPVTILSRFHTYSFLHTTDSTAILTSPEIYPSSTNFCVQMLIGLCTTCQMEITLVKFTGENENLGIVSGSKVAADHGLPMWQYVKINRTILTDSFSVLRLKLIPRLEVENENPFWAVANVRTCPPTDAVRYGAMEATQDYYNNVYHWPDVTCQKLFYDENVIVNSVPDATLNMQFDDIYCPEGKVGPYCSLSCYNHLENDVNCRGTVICENIGCTCSPGFIGKDCRSNCYADRYGHDCKETCGWCEHQNCNFKTGVCISGCDNSKRFNIPPFCKRGIDTLPPPEIDFINETTVCAVLPVRDEYKEVPSDYIFIIKKEGEVNDRTLGDSKKIFKNTSTLIGYIDDLQPGTAYMISCNLFVGNNYVPIKGEWQNVTTRCIPNIKFDIEVDETSIVLKKNQEPEALYSCPENWYDLHFQNVETGVSIVKGILPKLPYEFSKLTPYALYKVTVGKQNTTLFSREVRTLEGVPSQVRNLQKRFLSDKEVMLTWDPPQYPNGIIMKYDIALQVQIYFGCYNLRMRSPQNNTITTSTKSTVITFSDLHPYARYVATVAACTSYRGPVKNIEFTTKESNIPSSVYSNLRLENFTLKWDMPKDCTTISGPILAKIFIDGTSEAVKDYHDVKQTKSNSINLKSSSNVIYGAEQYRARIYTIRNYAEGHNELLYDELIFTTPPKVPPPIRNLEIYETDALTTTVYLRWQRPQPPLNGEMKCYIVSTCHSTCQFLQKVEPMDNCWFSNDYICAAVELPPRRFETFSVSAVNVNVTTPSRALFVPIIRKDEIPEAPENFTVDILGKGIVNLFWSHPWRTGGRLTKFLITIEMTSSNLRKEIPQSHKGAIYEHSISRYLTQYTEQLYLLPSTSYHVSIRGVTNRNVYGRLKSLEIETPLEIGFEKELTYEVDNHDSTILLHIPAVLNDTKNSIMNVVVKGPQPCEHYTRVNLNLSGEAGIKYYEIAWRAATFPTDELADKVFTVGNNKLYGGAINCPLKPEESYVIMVIVQTEEKSMNGRIIVAKTTSIRIGEVPKRHDEVWLIPIVIFLVIVAAAFYFYQRKKRRLVKELILQEGMALTHNIENFEGKATLSNSKQLLSTPTTPDKESLSRSTTPDVPTLVLDVNQKEDKTSLVKVKDFEDYVRQAINSGLLEKQYDTFPRGQTQPWDYGKLPQNKSKNRYGNLIAYDENRVILKKLPDDPFSDYINANYIQGYKKDKCYIATQGPKSNTVIDFWRMIWQEETLIICILANIIEGGKTKCEQYWPDIGKKKKYGDVIVLNAKHNVFADYTFRTLHVTCGEETRKIEHLHYTAWPDHGVPLYTHSVVTYLKKLLATSPGNGPVVVHCSAGVGRTGTIILCDICLRRAAAEGVVDVFAETESIRKQRANMVDNKQQYLLAHLALVECLLSFPTTLPCNEALPLKIKELKKQLAVQLQRLQDTAWQDEALRPMTTQTCLSERNLAKNRFPELVSAKLSRVYLKRYPPSDEDSDYISAVYVDGVRLQNQYLATQLPLPSTFNDFWRMIAEYKVELVVMLQPSDPGDTTCCPIVPTNGEFKPTPYINIKTKETIEFEFLTSQKLSLIDNSEKPAREQQVTILCSTEWKAGRNQDPPPVMTLVTLWQAAERISRGEGPTVVLCHDGVTGCGLYLALSFLLERMAVERECDVCLSIRAVRRSRPDFVPSLEHIEYLYDAAITYLEYFETYANFT